MRSGEPEDCHHRHHHHRYHYYYHRPSHGEPPTDALLLLSSLLFCAHLVWLWLFLLGRFDGKGSRVDIPFQQVLNLGSSWSAELWAYVEEEDGVEFQPMVALCSYSFSAEQVG